MEEIKINETGLGLIKKHEGLRLEVYRCAAGFATIGYGHKLQACEELNFITQAQAEEILCRDIAAAERIIASCVKTPLNENQHSALVSWVFNLGGGALRSSTLLKKLNEGKTEAVASEMMRWVMASGRPLKGLIRRRAEEATLFIS